MWRFLEFIWKWKKKMKKNESYKSMACSYQCIASKSWKFAGISIHIETVHLQTKQQHDHNIIFPKNEEERNNLYASQLYSITFLISMSKIRWRKLLQESFTYPTLDIIPVNTLCDAFQHNNCLKYGQICADFLHIETHIFPLYLCKFDNTNIQCHIMNGWRMHYWEIIL